jgi:hypothetical protein
MTPSTHETQKQEPPTVRHAWATSEFQTWLQETNFHKLKSTTDKFTSNYYK